MSQLLLSDFETAWAPSDPAVFTMTIDNTTFADPSGSSGLLVAESGASGAMVEFDPPAHVDLSGFDEIRFWVLGDQTADGSPVLPFFLEFSFIDGGDQPGEEHRWFVPVNCSGVWEQRRIGILGDRRSSIIKFRFAALTDAPFSCHVDELLAVEEDMVSDLEQALLDTLGSLSLSGATAVPLAVTAQPGDTQVVLTLATAFSAGNQVRLDGGSASPETHSVASATHDMVAGRTTLTFAAGDVVAGTLSPPAATATMVIPAIAQAPPVPTAGTSPAVWLTCLEIREDLERTRYATQRDSFRQRGSVIVCSVRPPARAYAVDYQVTAVAPVPSQMATIYSQATALLTMDRPLRINGSPAPVSGVAAPVLLTREPGSRSPLYIRIGTRMETAARQEETWVRTAEVEAAPFDAPLDTEGIVLQL